MCSMLTIIMTFVVDVNSATPQVTLSKSMFKRYPNFVEVNSHGMIS